mgnify:CR=1 FL=1
MTFLTRRHFLAGTATTLAMAALPASVAETRAQTRTRIDVTTRTLEVNGKAAKVFGLAQPDGTRGLYARQGDRFAVDLVNRLDEPTLVHWHGLTPPWQQDGVPEVTQPAIPAGERFAYDFELRTPGTHWMHSHYGLQEQGLLSAPLIIRSKKDEVVDEQEIVVELNDFSFTPADEILDRLRSESGADAMAGMAGMGTDTAAMKDQVDQGSQPRAGMSMPNSAPMPGMQKADKSGQGSGNMIAMPMAMTMDVNDIDFDAYLANDRTLDDPEVFDVERGGQLRLRIINGAASTNFTVDLGDIDGQLIAVDGNEIEPVWLKRVPLAMAQRADIRLKMPIDGRSRGILFLREGGAERSGIVLRPPRAKVSRISVESSKNGPLVDLSLERHLSATKTLPVRTPDRRILFHLTGAMGGYVWGWRTDGPFRVLRGERVEIDLQNDTMMSHPMHLHGHHFQVVAINGVRMKGAMRDTVLVPPGTTVAIAFDADNPGHWAFHCHNLYHMAVGMMTTLEYQSA